MQSFWDINRVVSLVESKLTSFNPDMVITFDSYGVSGHSNHRAVHLGIQRLIQRRMCTAESTTHATHWRAWQLVSTSVLQKFLGPVSVPMALWEAARSGGWLEAFTVAAPLDVVHAMACHRSQWVWFRKLFVLFSRYTYVNTLVPMHPP
mmetsp:Transcript_8104/g.24076  ORF Transcript_8104/g.24076 Transcript_8104/m.24076 type:complete len:149 (-) Transcript_8104:133-579(-)